MRSSLDSIDALVHQAVYTAIARRDSEDSLRALARAMRELAAARHDLAGRTAEDDVGGMAHALARLEAARERLAGAVRACGGAGGSGAAN